MTEPTIKTITGIINSLSVGASTVNGGSNFMKSNTKHEYDYIEIDGRRWGNVALSGSVNAKLTQSIGKKVTFHYIEDKKGGALQRIVAGIEGDDGVIEPILLDESKPVYNQMKLVHYLYLKVYFGLWALIGLFVTKIVVAESAGEVVGWVTYLAGFWVMYLLSPMRKILPKIKLLLVFSKTHNRIV
jgi:hypothetical protein